MANKKAQTALKTLRQTEPVAYFLMPDNLPLFTTALSGAELNIAISRLQSGV
jgi:hypothetical protein